MRFLYLVQSKSKKPYPELKNCIYLTFGEQIPGAIYFPNSTWTTGRNKLLEAAKDLANNGDIYDYYVFCDDDVVWETGSWSELEKKVTIDKPDIAIPTLKGYPYRKGRVFMYDACVNVFSKDVIMQTDLLPYVSDFDEKSWYYSQFIVIYRSLYMFNDKQIKRYTELTYANINHSSYPKEHSVSRVLPYMIAKYDIAEKYKSKGYKFSDLKWETIQKEA